MNGPEHYVAAERLLAEGSDVVAEIREVRDEDRRDALGKQAHGIWLQAQVHATLALAAAQALSPITVSMGDTDRITEWARATAPSLNTTEGK